MTDTHWTPGRGDTPAATSSGQ